jgi:uncharacterized protein
MPQTMSNASVDAYVRGLNVLSAIIDKAAAHAEAKKIDPNVYVTLRLRPDMMAFSRQVQTASDQAKGGAARLAGIDPPKFEDNEATLADLKARIAKTIEFVQSVDRGAIDASSDRDIVFPQGQNKLKLKGADYLSQLSLPNFYFHVTTAYDILRYAGVEIGKRDYLGAVQAVPA